jgi:hypothetical protein
VRCRDQIVKLETEICEYREIIDYLNKSLNELMGTEGTRFLNDEGPAPVDLKPRIELEFESE